MFLAAYTQQIIGGLSVLTIVGQAISLVLLFFLVQSWIQKKTNPKVKKLLQSRGLLFMLIVALTATLGSLYFSEIAGWTPCKLCWFQRIFMYPQAVILLIAAWKRDKKILPYIIALSSIGLLIAAGHYTEQVMATLYPAQIDPNVPCDASGASCASKFVFHFGYITIPLMAFTAFLMNLLTSALMLRKK